jgi:hypothetical protein
MKGNLTTFCDCFYNFAFHVNSHYGYYFPRGAKSLSTPRHEQIIMKEVVECYKPYRISITCLQKRFNRTLVQRWLSRMVIRDEW